MKNFDFENFLNLEWDTSMYKKNENLLSIGYVKTSNKRKIIFMSPKKFEDENIINKLRLVELRELPAKYLAIN